MKKKDLINLRQKDASELEKRLVELKTKLMTVAPKIAAGAQKNLKDKKILRRDIAQILSIMHEQKTKMPQKAASGKKEEIQNKS